MPVATDPTASKRDAVLRAALELFEEQGYGATPVPAIAARAGVGVGTIYRSFPSKEALVNALYREGKARMAAHLPSAEQLAGLTAREGFALWWDGLWRFATREPEWFAFVEVHHHAPYLDDESRAVGERLDAEVAAFVRRGQRAGEIRAGRPEVLQHLVLGAFVGLVRAGELHPRLRSTTQEAAWALLAHP